MAEENKKILNHTADGDHVVAVGEHKPKQTFGGGGGAGITLQPLAFLVVKDGDVKLLQIATASNTADKVVNSVPDIIDKISDAIVKAKDQKSGAAKPEKAE